MYLVRYTIFFKNFFKVFFPNKNFLMIFFGDIFWWYFWQIFWWILRRIFWWVFFNEFFWQIFIMNYFEDFFDNFFWRFFLTKFFDKIFVKVFWQFFSLLTIASFRIGVPSILFLSKMRVHLKQMSFKFTRNFSEFIWIWIHCFTK